mgnify:CR=1 FL=1
MGIEEPTHSVLLHLTRYFADLCARDAQKKVGNDTRTENRSTRNRGVEARESNPAALGRPTFVRYAHGQWKQDELDLLRLLITTSRGVRAERPDTNRIENVADGQSHQPRDKRNRDDRVDWHWVCEEMLRAGTARSRHQVLCKAVEMGLKSESEVDRGLVHAMFGSHDRAVDS